MSKEAPSATEVQPAGERSPHYEQTLAEIERVLDASPAEQRAFIDQRTAALAEGAAQGELWHAGRSIHAGFIGPEMKVRRNIMVEPLTMDDPNLYMDFFETLRSFKAADAWKGQTMRDIAPTAIQWTLSKYFGNVAASSRTEMENRACYLEHSVVDVDERSPNISVADLKGKGIAVCAEKGAAAQNLVTFAGLESELIASSGNKLSAEPTEEAHFYLLLHSPRGPAIYDPTNPRVALNADRSITSYGPATYRISEAQASELVRGGTVTVEHVDVVSGPDGTQQLERTERLYVGPHKR